MGGLWTKSPDVPGGMPESLNANLSFCLINVVHHQVRTDYQNARGPILDLSASQRQKLKIDCLSGQTLDKGIGSFWIIGSYKAANLLKVSPRLGRKRYLEFHERIRFRTSSEEIS